MFNAKHFEIVCNTEWEKDGIRYTMTEENIAKVLADLPCQYAYILHDKDTLETGEPKKPHWHIYVNFGRNSWRSDRLATRFGLADNFVGKVKGRSGDMLAYLTHANAEEKHQYNEEEVRTNFDWKSERDKSLATKKKDVRAGIIRDGIVNGSIRLYNLFDHITAEEYHVHKRVIEHAFEYRTMTIRGANRDMDAIYIYGDSGTGKTTYAKQLASEKNYSVFVSSGSNDPLDGYQGEDCIILDDIRPSCMKLSDLLKMLDNNTASSVASRYRNKVLECKLIVLTSTLPIDSFFGKVFENDKETAVQLKRRCRSIVHMLQDKIETYVWLTKSRKYRKMPDIPNIILQNLDVGDFTEEEAIDYVADMLGSIGAYVKQVSTDLKNGEFTQITVDDEELPF